MPIVTELSSEDDDNNTLEEGEDGCDVVINRGGGAAVEEGGGGEGLPLGEWCGDSLVEGGDDDVLVLWC